ncbi:MAG: TetR/AcrR family transcriptional regulator [Acinetobacter sp.]|nr:TetR/AcrR family transcriptional regulator [Acinetobacter sp.]
MAKLSSQIFSDPVQDSQTTLTHRGLERRQSILTIAYELFLQHGFHAVSLDDIIQKAGGSKASIYKYFGDKTGLFRAICDFHLNQRLVKFSQTWQQDVSLEQYLYQQMQDYYHHVTNPDYYLFMHMLIKQAQPNDELIAHLNERWRNEVAQSLENSFVIAHQLGIIHCPNPYFSALHFWGISHELHWKTLLRLELPKEAMVMDYLQYSLKQFLKGHDYQFVE